MAELTDQQILTALVDSEKLTDVQAEAFTTMLDTVSGGRSLSRAQRQWAKDIHQQLGLEIPVANLVSSGKVKVTQAERESLKQFLGGLGPKVLKPPVKARR